MQETILWTDEEIQDYDPSQDEDYDSNRCSWCGDLDTDCKCWDE